MGDCRWTTWSHRWQSTRAKSSHSRERRGSGSEISLVWVPREFSTRRAPASRCHSVTDSNRSAPWPAQLEQGLAANQGDVLVQCVVDSKPEIAQDRDGWAL